MFEILEHLPYSKTYLGWPLKKKTKNWFLRQIIALCISKVLQNAPRVLQNAPLGAFCILLTFIKLPFVIKSFALSIFEWPLKTGFTVMKIIFFVLYYLITISL